MTYSSYQVGELFEQIRNGLTVENDPKSGGLPITRIETIANGEIDPVRVGYSGIEIGEKDSWLLEEGDILFSHINSLSHIGKCAIYQGVPEKLIHGMNLLSFRPRKQILLPEYALYLFRSNTFKSKLARSIKPSVNQASVGIKDIQKILVDIPPLATQKHIAQVLEQADQLRKQAQQMESELNQLAQSLFLEMFGNPLSSLEKNSETLGKHIEFLTSGSRGWAEYYSESGALFIRSLDVQMNQLEIKNAAYVNPPENAEGRRTKVEPGDVLLTITGSRIGRVCEVPKTIGDAYISQHVALIRPKKSMNSTFLSTFLSLPLGGQAQIAQSQYGQTKPGLNLEQIRNFLVPSASDAQQKAFAEAYKRLEAEKAANVSLIGYLEDLFQALMQRAFKGELTAPGSKAA